VCVKYFVVIPGRRDSGEPGIHAAAPVLGEMVPGSRFACPGMTSLIVGTPVCRLRPTLWVPDRARRSPRLSGTTVSYQFASSRLRKQAAAIPGCETRWPGPSARSRYLRRSGRLRAICRGALLHARGGPASRAHPPPSNTSLSKQVLAWMNLVPAISGCPVRFLDLAGAAGKASPDWVSRTALLLGGSGGFDGETI